MVDGELDLAYDETHVYFDGRRNKSDWNLRLLNGLIAVFEKYYIQFRVKTVVFHRA